MHCKGTPSQKQLRLMQAYFVAVSLAMTDMSLALQDDDSECWRGQHHCLHDWNCRVGGAALAQRHQASTRPAGNRQQACQLSLALLTRIPCMRAHRVQTAPSIDPSCHRCAV